MIKVIDNQTEPVTSYSKALFKLESDFVITTKTIKKLLNRKYLAICYLKVRIILPQVPLTK